MVDHTYQYTLTCTPEGASRLDIRSASDGALLSRTDVNCIHGTLFTEGQMLVLAGECAQGTQLQFFDISDPTNPILHRTLVQEGCYLGAWKADGSLLVSSVYQVKDAVDFIPGIYDSSSDQKKLLAADRSFCRIPVPPLLLPLLPQFLSRLTRDTLLSPFWVVAV